MTIIFHRDGISFIQSLDYARAECSDFSDLGYTICRHAYVFDTVASILNFFLDAIKILNLNLKGFYFLLFY